MQRYLRWTALHNFCNTTAYVISTDSLLHNVIANPSYAQVATATYIGRDIVGQIGGVFYGWKKGEKADVNPKKHVLFGTILNQVALHVENGIGYTNDYFQIVSGLCLTSIAKNISFIAVGAVKAKNLNSIAKKGEIGSVYSKLASINTLSSTLGMTTGIVLTATIKCPYTRTLGILPILNVLSVYSAYKSVLVAEEITKGRMD